MSRETSIPSLLREHKKSLVVGFLSLSVVDLIQMAIPLVIRRATDAFTEGGPDTAAIIRACALAILGMGIVMSVFRLGWRYFIMGSARKIEQSLRNRFFSHLQRLGMEDVDSRKVGDFMTRAVNDIETLKFACGLGVLVAYDGLFLLTFIMGAMFYISPGLAAVVCAPFALMMVFVVKGGREIETRFGRTQEFFSTLTESARRPLHGMKAVKSLRLEGKEAEMFSRSSGDYVKSNIHLAGLWAVYQPAISLCVGMAGVAFLYFGGSSAMNGSITLGDFTAMLVYLTMLNWPMMAMGWAQDILRRGNSSVKRLNSILKLDCEPETPDGQLPSPAPRGALEARDVRVSFDGKEVLSGCSLLASPGETVFITGATGCGKTTLALVAAGAVVPDGGGVFIGGKDIRSFDRRTLAGLVSVVRRDPFIFSGTVAENINFMKPAPDGGGAEEAARVCGIREEIEDFGGFDAVLGERGINISEGQKQRIALARAVIFEPAVLILDDALSSVDLSTEARVMENLREWAARTRTALVVMSSRVNSSRIADRIAVMGGGAVAESGSRDDLLRKGGIYAGLDRIQAQ
ncbi:MAG: ABC transporter ATP-binding protein [Candidatus Dadabacteria bacterium]|nr:ABC transporter ATP-binding protein [Candidatus Dadabacteria bacterium]